MGADPGPIAALHHTATTPATADSTSPLEAGHQSDEEEETLELVPDENYVPKPKPVVVAQKELVDGKIKVREQEY